MEITDISSFLKYFARIKSRTRRLFPLIPPDKIEWTYHEQKFTIGDLIRHLALIERYMYAETIKGNPSSYEGCGPRFATGYEASIQLYEDLHQESVDIFSQLSPTQLLEKCTTPGGIQISTWKWLRAMVEHEVHHRGQLYTYLGLLNIDVPPIFGLSSEEVIVKSQV